MCAIINANIYSSASLYRLYKLRAIRPNLNKVVAFMRIFIFGKNEKKTDLLLKTNTRNLSFKEQARWPDFPISWKSYLAMDIPSKKSFEKMF